MADSKVILNFGDGVTELISKEDYDANCLENFRVIGATKTQGWDIAVPNDIEHSEQYKDELYHHGILHQKWGKRNGPPYPLDWSDHSTAEKKELSKEDYEKKTELQRAKNNYDREVQNGKETENRIRQAEVERARIEKDYDRATDKGMSKKEARLKKKSEELRRKTERINSNNEYREAKLRKLELQKRLKQYKEEEQKEKYNKKHPNAWISETLKAGSRDGLKNFVSNTIAEGGKRLVNFYLDTKIPKNVDDKEVSYERYYDEGVKDDGSYRNAKYAYVYKNSKKLVNQVGKH